MDLKQNTKFWERAKTDEGQSFKVSALPLLYRALNLSKRLFLKIQSLIKLF